MSPHRAHAYLSFVIAHASFAALSGCAVDHSGLRTDDADVQVDAPGSDDAGNLVDAPEAVDAGLDAVSLDAPEDLDAPGPVDAGTEDASTIDAPISDDGGACCVAPVLAEGPTISPLGTQNLESETFTLTYAGDRTFTVVGSVSGAHENAHVGEPYVTTGGTGGRGAGLSFTVQDLPYGDGASLSMALAVGGNADLSAATCVTTSLSPKDCTLGDPDGDGDLDIACGGTGANPVRVFANDGTGTMSATLWLSPETFSTLVSDSKGADVNADGFADIVNAYSSLGGTTFVNAMLSDAGDFDEGATSSAMYAVRSLGEAELADIDGDGFLDLVANVSRTVLDHTERGLLVFPFVEASGSFGGGAWASAEISNDGPGTMALGDIDGDGDIDAVMTGDEVSVFVNADGVLSLQGSLDASVSEVALQDVTADGALDVVAVTSDQVLEIYENDGNGEFAFSTDFDLEDSVHSYERVALGDFDGDGDFDVAARSRESGHSTAMIVTNDDGEFTAGSEVQPGNGVLGLAAGDLDNNGGIDLVSYGASPYAVCTMLTGVMKTVSVTSASP